MLHHLAAAGTLDMVRLFKGLGMQRLDPNHMDKGGKTPLQILAQRHDIDLELHAEFQAVFDSVKLLADDDTTLGCQQDSEDLDGEFLTRSSHKMRAGSRADAVSYTQWRDRYVLFLQNPTTLTTLLVNIRLSNPTLRSNLGVLPLLSKVFHCILSDQLDPSVEMSL